MLRTDYQFRPLDWAGPSTPGQRKTAQFRATYPATLDLLFREVAQLYGKHLVIQADIRERDIRTDGLPRANARFGEHPGVIITFDSVHGPLRYATDVFTDWQDNLRAIALALEALRAVDRYGVSKTGQQYTGWRALEAGTAPAFASADAALRWMREQLPDSVATGLGNGAAGSMYRQLARRLHPDAGGDPDDWERLDAARRVLATAGVL